MFSAGLLCARCTVPFVPPSNTFIRRHGRWPFRRSGKPPWASTGARSLAAYSIAIACGTGIGFVAYENHQPFRHTVLAVVRCSRVASEWYTFLSDEPRSG